MSSAGVDAILFGDQPSPPGPTTAHGLDQGLLGLQVGAASKTYQGARRTPRKSLIVVLPEDHVVSPDLVSERLPAEGDSEAVDVILACAGQPLNIATLQRRVRDLQVLLAPAGTSSEDLRELAMNQAPGDIVTLLSGTPAAV
jgi:hypothetical protein